MRAIMNRNVNIDSNIVLGREFDSLIKYSSRYQNNCNDINDAVNHYMIAVGTAGQLVLAAVELENLEAANKIRKFLENIKIDDFTNGGK